MLCTDAPSGVMVCPTFAVLDEENLIINLTIADDSEAPASALTIIASMLDFEVDIPFSEPVLPTEAVVIPSAVVIPIETVNASVFTLEVNAKNMLSSTFNVLSTTFSYPLCECSACCTNNVVFDAITVCFTQEKVI